MRPLIITREMASDNPKILSLRMCEKNMLAGNDFLILSLPPSITLIVIPVLISLDYNTEKKTKGLREEKKPTNLTIQIQ